MTNTGHVTSDTDYTGWTPPNGQPPITNKHPYEGNAPQPPATPPDLPSRGEHPRQHRRLPVDIEY